MCHTDGADVAVCDVDRYEVDLIADPAGTPSYWQVTMSISDADTRERELRPLRAIRDYYPRTVITYEPFLSEDIDGIRVVALKDWLLGSD